MPAGDQGFIPPWQDIATLTRHICLSESTIEEWVKLGLLPPPRKKRGKRLWKWAEVEQYLDNDCASGVHSADDEARRIADATRAALNERH